MILDNCSLISCICEVEVTLPSLSISFTVYGKGQRHVNFKCLRISTKVPIAFKHHYCNQYFKKRKGQAIPEKTNITEHMVF